MTSLEKLASLFERFPGIGPRQARRFVFHLLTTSPRDLSELSDLIATIKDRVVECSSCFRFFAKSSAGEKVCDICSDPSRDPSLLMVVERDADVVPIEKSGTFAGYYFVLGGTIPLLESEDAKKLRGGALKSIIDERLKQGLAEVVLAFSVNPDGENTARYVEHLLAAHTEAGRIRITRLGRGLSTGSELEYADPETITEAFRHRA